MNLLLSALSRYVRFPPGGRRRPSPGRASAGRQRQRTRLYLETLEERQVPAQITGFGAGITAGSLPEAITRGADGNLWFTEDNALGRITPSGTVTEFSLAALQ